MPIFTLAGTAIAGALFAGSALAATVISAGLAYGASLLWQQINRPKARTYSAVQGEVQYGANVPVGTMLGTGKVKGHKIFYAKYGSGNKFNAEVFLLSNGWCDGLEPQIMFEGVSHTLVARPIIGNEVAHYGVDGFGNLISVRFYDGRPGQQADMKLVADSAGLGQIWKATSVCAGMAYVVVEREYSEDKFKSHPEFEFVLRGLRLYDPRKDGTVAGGAGAHRLANPATWEFSKNPALQRLNYQLGLRGLISGRTLIGEGKSLGQLDLGSYIAAMNACDAIRAGKPTYQASLYVTGNDDHTEILRELDDAMAGYALNRRGLSGVVAGAPQIPVATIGINDLPVGRAQEIKKRKSAFELYNHMSGQFTSIESLWTPESLTPVFVNADVAADGRTRQTSNDFLQVTDPDIAQYLLNIRYRQQRKGGSATVPVSRRLGLQVQEGEWITFDGTQWLITGWRCDSQLRVTLTLAETGADVYSEAGIIPGPIVVPSTPPVNPSLLSTVQNFNVEVGFIGATDDQEVPALRFTWTAPADPTITAVRFFYFVGNDPTGQTIYEDRSTTPEAGEYTTTKDVVPGVYYTARATITTVPDRFKTFTPYVTTETVTGPFKLFDPFEGVVGIDQLDNDLDSVLARIGVNMRDMFEQQQALALLAGGQDLANAATFNEVRRELSTAVGGQAASFAEIITTQVTPIDGRLTAIADLLTQLSAGEGSDISTARWLMTAVDGPSGYASLLGQARVDGADGYRSASFGVDVPVAAGLPGRFFVDADQFVVRVGTDRLSLLIVDEAGLRVANAFIRNLTAANIDVNALTATAGFFANFEATWAQIDSAVINNFVAQSSNIGDLTVGTIKIPAGAVSTVYSSVTAANVALPTGSPNAFVVASVTVPVIYGQVLIQYALILRQQGTGAANLTFRVRKNGVDFFSKAVNLQVGEEKFFSGFFNDSSPGASNVYDLYLEGSTYSVGTGSGAGSGIIATNNKR
jgi:hypothetical protein